MDQLSKAFQIWQAAGCCCHDAADEVLEALPSCVLPRVGVLSSSASCTKSSNNFGTNSAKLAHQQSRTCVRFCITHWMPWGSQLTWQHAWSHVEG